MNSPYPSETGCCLRFIPGPWEEKELHSPAVAGDQVFLRTSAAIYCLARADWNTRSLLRNPGRDAFPGTLAPGVVGGRRDQRLTLRRRSRNKAATKTWPPKLDRQWAEARLART